MSTYEEKRSQLQNLMRQYSDCNVIVAFSGGVDSSLLLKLACEYHTSKTRKVYAVTFRTMLHPVKDIETAGQTAGEIGAEHIVIDVDELSDAGIIENPVNRCYLCKKCLFMHALDLAKGLDTEIIIEGTNEDDLHVYRPGIRAVKELGLISPLADVGMTKEDVRRLAAEYGLSAANRPSKPCLATRFPYGTHLSYDMMKVVERGEAIIESYGFYNVRLRVHGAVARIEVDEESIEQLLSYRKQLTEELKALGYRYITIDLEGFRSGSMDQGGN